MSGVEFIGGPLDGEIMDLDRHYYEWVVPLANPAMNVWQSFADQITDGAWKPIDLRNGIYRRDGRNPSHMLWLGER